MRSPSPRWKRSSGIARLVVFGGGGFVGGHLAAAALRQGWEVHVSDRGGLGFTHLDARDECAEAIDRVLAFLQ